ncbi:SDR family oxidoreductase [Acetobacter oeni]|uniref:Short-chain dehydrogenase/reductase n=1 Tax=Acetobacter oeni TaxID=304077 RepID=A0A511XNG1_9PROT|nr:SDR family oxidoreductase [Acetobacter oeni]MBB3884341.1 NAD(P)-dependent dehydrogenase (short-subunit alcohol dehydrogenase family) [Acetobacter oeni]NHO20307.1 SDR family NAD(P)-dependent oxidoreductase [Acetobacter oeni]GBR05259.1 dehydrogenase [Acetobacter oeni LMG 21952]GEN64481.1 short-chain dehydrogenase/reductase [Acetobacter oeni]
MKSILITGCSSGFGLETAKHFLDRGWRVIATMRTPHEDILPAAPNLEVLQLDVTDPASIARAIAAAGEIDVLVNNAGIGWLNAVEGTSIETVRRIFETNTFGTIAMIQAILPQFRERRSGTIVNVTSSVTLRSLPLLSVYTASKAAVNAFTESFALEIEPFNIKVKLVLPGLAPDTRFGENARALAPGALDFPAPYMPLGQAVIAGLMGHHDEITRSSDVAEAIWQAATDDNAPARIYAGADAITWSKQA